MRKCRICSAVLPTTRYFKCLTCQPELPQGLDDDSVYFDTETEELTEVLDNKSLQQWLAQEAES